MAFANGNGKRPFQMPEDRRVKLCFKAQDGSEIYYRVNADIKIQKLLMTYSREKNLEYKDLRFLYNGQRLPSTQSPAELGMHDEDQVDVMIYQHGGGVRVEYSDQYLLQL